MKNKKGWFIAVCLLQAVLITALICGAQYKVWQYFNHEISVINSDSVIDGFAYSPYQKMQDPKTGVRPTDAEIRADMRLLSEKTKRIRTYSSLENPQVASIANEFGIKVTQGIWLDRDSEKNEKEIEAGIALANANPNIERLMVGNESVMRQDLTADQLVSIIQRVRKGVKNHKVIITTAETWDIWLKNPQLAQEVWQITVHLLPFNEGLSINDAVKYSLQRYDEVQNAYPKKHMLIGETGWPSNGDDYKGSHPSIENEARYVREFLVQANKRDLDYFLMEAVDQPWKAAQEGWIGAYWGMYNADRQPKFKLEGPVSNSLYWKQKAELATYAGIIPIFILCLLLGRLKFMGKFWMSFLLQLCISVVVIAIALPKDYYMSQHDIVVLALLILGMVTTSAVLLIQAFEVLEVLYSRHWNRAFNPATPVLAEEEPLVCIHLACCNEPPDMVIETVESLRKLRYTNFQVMVIDNNTKDDSLWKPVQAYMKELDPKRFKFYHLPQISGFKAGALNFALRETDPEVKVIAVIDADYVVTPEWLSELVPHFKHEKTAVVQAPQAHRLWEHSLFRRWVNWEFDGFFRIGMHHRNERNALIQHGTMTMVRRDCLEKVGGWSEWCICEDTELGLRLLEDGMELQYVDKVYGHGLTPTDFAGLKSQRFRWAFGAMQILKGHLGQLTGKSSLNLSQRYHFLTGWIPWISEMLQFIFSFATIFWTIAMIANPRIFNVPVVSLITPVLALMVCKGLMGVIAYRLRVKCSWLDVLGTSIVSVALSHSIARGVFAGIVKKTGTFVVTPKGWKAKKGFHAMVGPVREEIGMLLTIVFAIGAYAGTHNLGLSALSWIGVMVMQAIPYFCSLICQITALGQRSEEEAMDNDKKEPLLIQEIKDVITEKLADKIGDKPLDPPGDLA